MQWTIRLCVSACTRLRLGFWFWNCSVCVMFAGLFADSSDRMVTFVDKQQANTRLCKRNGKMSRVCVCVCMPQMVIVSNSQWQLSWNATGHSFFRRSIFALRLVRLAFIFIDVNKKMLNEYICMWVRECLYTNIAYAGVWFFFQNISEVQVHRIQYL